MGGGDNDEVRSAVSGAESEQDSRIGRHHRRHAEEMGRSEGQGSASSSAGRHIRSATSSAVVESLDTERRSTELQAFPTMQEAWLKEIYVNII